jgi:hypothetical protein
LVIVGLPSVRWRASTQTCQGADIGELPGLQDLTAAHLLAGCVSAKTGSEAPSVGAPDDQVQRLTGNRAGLNKSDAS